MENQNDNFIYGTINLPTDEDFDKFIDNLDYPQSVFILTQALQHAFNHGIYNLKETELLSKAIRKVLK
jgi:hypothetical protein